MDFFSFACSFSLFCREVSSGDQVGWWAEGKFQKALCPLLKHLDFLLRGGSHCLHWSCRGFVKQYVSKTWSAHLMLYGLEMWKGKGMEAWPRLLNNWQGLAIDCMWEVKDIFIYELVGKRQKEGSCLWREVIQTPSEWGSDKGLRTQAWHPEGSQRKRRWGSKALGLWGLFGGGGLFRLCGVQEPGHRTTLGSGAGLRNTTSSHNEIQL